jgi:hypothetical protein
MIETLIGNTLQMTSKFTVKAISKVSASFMVSELFVLGTNITGKIVYERFCC